jgi:soluble lytic murein transglycosylase
MKARSLQVTFGLVALALAGTTTIWVAQSREETRIKPRQEVQETVQPDRNLPSEVFPLLSLSPPERRVKLEQIAQNGHHTDQARAHYLLATIALEENQPETAINHLKGLEEDYPLLGGHILLKRAEAYELKGDVAQARETWYQIAQNSSNPAIVGEAFYHLGQYNDQEWEELMTEFPEHPRTHEVIKKRLAENPNQLPLMLILAHYAPEDEGTGKVRDRLVNDYRSQLSAEDWAAIAEGYWETWEYQKAGKAYGNAPKTPENLYRHARGLQVSGETRTAKTIYLELLNTFPDAEETGLGLRRLAGMVSRQDGIFHLDQVINQFPKEAPEALVTQAKLLQAANSPQSSQQAIQTLLSDYSQSDAAAKYRWEQAQQQDQQGNLTAAINWAEEITLENNNSSLAAKAGFWQGKWLQEQGKAELAQKSFRQTLSQHPESYYAWRSAVYLGLPVGDFDTIRTQIPKVVKPASRPLLPAGSDLLTELYQLGEDQAAWQLWRTQTANQSFLSVEEQFTDGVLQLTQGRYLKGIAQISSLQYREEADDVSRWQSLRETSMYWHSLFPFPYNDSIISWSEKRQLNPLLTTSLIRQESRFEKDIRSVAGATGLMQIMPSTGEWVASKLNLKEYSLVNPEQNINLGTWYLDYTHDRYNNHSMLAVASYNAGPGNVAKWVKRYGLEDTDEFVQKIPFSETKGYVEAVFGNYWNYLRLYNPEVQKLLEDRE